MAGSPSKNLLELVPHDVILQELESGVKSLPTVAKCPINPEHKFRLHPDDSSIWGSCDQCGFSGDSIDILQAKYKTLSVEEVICQLERNGLVKDISRELVLDYQLHKVKREGWVRFLADAREKLSNRGFDIRVLNAFGAPPPFRKEWYEGFGKFVGLASRLDLAALLGINMTKLSHDTLMLPYYDMPGRVASIRLVSYNSNGLVFSDKSTIRSGGLFMLGAVSPCEEYVIAVDDPMLACQVQMRRMENSLVHLPIVAWHPDTKYWPINPKRIVFWAPDPKVATFNQARKVPGAYLCSPHGTTDFDAILREKDVKNWVHHVMMNAKPWALALKESLLSMDESVAVKFARDLEITPMETGEILFECDSAEKARLSEILDLRSSVRNVMAGDTKVIDRDDAWWTHTEKGRLIRVTNAPFSIDKSAHYDGKGSYLLGTLTMDGRAERFMAPADDFMSGPSKWLRKFALQKGMGIVQTLPGWETRLVDLAFRFGTDKVQHVNGKAIVGWSDSLDKFTFPGVALINGRVDECDLGLPVDDMPCVKVTSHPTQRSAWASFTEDTQANRVFWAMLACISLNMGSKLLGHPMKKIGVIGPQRNLSLVASVLDFVSIPISSMGGATRKVQAYSVHDVPVCLYPVCGFKQFADWLESSGIKNVMVNVNHSQAAMLGGVDWIFVDARDMSGSISHFHAGTNLLADMVRILQGVQKDGEVLIENQFLDMVRSWSGVNKCECASDVFDGAKKLITQGSMYGAINICEAFLYSLFSMIMDDQVTVSRSLLSKKVGEIDISEKYVKVSKNLLQKMLIPVGTLALTNELQAFKYLVKHSSSEWLLERDKWDALYEKWIALREA